MFRSIQERGAPSQEAADLEKNTNITNADE